MKILSRPISQDSNSFFSSPRPQKILILPRQVERIVDSCMSIPTHVSIQLITTSPLTTSHRLNPWPALPQLILSVSAVRDATPTR